MNTTSLSRSKLVTRDIKETLDYTPFGVDQFAVHVSVIVEGVDPFTADEYGIVNAENLKKMLAGIAKSKSDFPYRDELSEHDQSNNWIYVTAADLKKFQSLPDDDMASDYGYAEYCERAKAGFSSSDRKKIYNNAVKKDGKNLLWFNWYDHSFKRADGNYLSLPVGVDYGINSTNFLMIPLVEKLRTMKNVRMRIPREFDQSNSKYPELKNTPYYNAEVDGQTEVNLWILLTDEDYTRLKNEETSLNSYYLLQKEGILPISEFKLVKND